MPLHEIDKKYDQFTDLVKKRQLKEAFDQLKQFTVQYQVGQFNFNIDNFYETYKNILKYSFELIEDPEKEKIYNHLIKSLLELGDEVKETILIKNKHLNYYLTKEELTKLPELSENEPEEIIEKIVFEKEINKILKDTGTAVQGEKPKAYTEAKINHFFNIIWFTDKFKDAEIHLVKKICHASAITWYDKCLLVSALTLSLHRYFDEHKISLLFEFFEANEDKVWQRALIGIFTTILHYESRLMLYPEIIFKLKEIGSNSQHKRDLENIIIQYLRSKETEKISKKIQEEILPEMMKFRSALEDKLDLKNITNLSQIEDKNPEWETYFKDSPGLYDKIEQFTKLQMEGADVFISAFAALKYFSFFNQFVNWFKPFFKENEAVLEALKDLGQDFKVDDFTEGLERSAILCNSDKYSFCLNVKFLPSAQKQMITDLFGLEMKAMNEMANEDDKINLSAKNKASFTQYLQDLYRFYKLHPLKKEFYDFFSIRFDFSNSILFKEILGESDVLRNIAEFYFEKSNYTEALEIFEFLMKNQSDYELVEKIGYCYQQLCDFKKALEYYQKAELFDKNKAWILKKIAFCYRALNQFKEAVNYYKEAEKLEPDNLYIQAYLGHTYMDLKDFSTALKYYFKVEYLEPDNQKVQRPIAWCSFMLGKFDGAKKHLQKLIDNEKNKNDYLTMGHVEWCQGNKSSAIKNYISAMEVSNLDYSWFSNEFEHDSQYLTKHGISALDIPLMMDFIKINAGKNEKSID